MQVTRFNTNKVKGKAYLFNITQNEFFVSRTYGHYHILPTNPGTPWQVIVIEDTDDRLDMGEEQYYRIPILAEDIAIDIAGEFAAHGVGISKGPRPTEAEVAIVRKRLEAFYKLKLAEGDAMWAKTGRHENVEDVSRRAAIYFGEQRPWAFEVLSKITCPGCSEKVLAGIAKHSCGAIVDVDRAQAAGIISDQEADRLRKHRKKLDSKAPAKVKAAPVGDFIADADDTEDAEELAAKTE